MASMNLGPFGEHRFPKPPNPLAAIGSFVTTHQPFSSASTSSRPPNFCSLSISKPSGKQPKQEPDDSDSEPRKPGKNKEMLDQFWWECENLPDYRNDPEVERIYREGDSYFEKKENPTPEEIEENKRVLEELRNSPVLKFMLKAEEIRDGMNERELKENKHPFKREDRDLWNKVPLVPGLDGRPMPRKSIKNRKEANDKFWDFMKQFLFGLWGFRQRPYPPGKPLDVAQAIGYKQLERRYYDFVMKTGGWYYKDRLGRSRGPCELIQLKTAWGGGIIDTHTFVWGEDMDEWAPIGMVYGLEPAIATWEAKLGAATTAFLHKFRKGIPPWVPVKGHEPKTYKQLQEEAIESKKRDIAVLEANDGVWPGVRTPSHALFLWASGAELTNVLEQDHMPNRFIPKQLREILCKAIPGLRPWEVLSVEQAMDHLTFGGKWYREPLGCYKTGPPYIQEWNDDFDEFSESLGSFFDEYVGVDKLFEFAMPFWDKVMKRYNEKWAPLMKERWRVKLEEKRKQRNPRYLYGVDNDRDDLKKKQPKEEDEIDDDESSSDESESESDTDSDEDDEGGEGGSNNTQMMTTSSLPPEE